MAGREYSGAKPKKAWAPKDLPALGATRAREDIPDELLRSIARATLVRAMLNPEAPVASQVTASRAALEMTGDIKPADRYSLMSLEQLRALNEESHVDPAGAENTRHLERRDQSDNGSEPLRRH
jgi:hypothetical protein